MCVKRDIVGKRNDARSVWSVFAETLLTVELFYNNQNTSGAVLEVGTKVKD